MTVATVTRRAAIAVALAAVVVLTTFCAPDEHGPEDIEATGFTLQDGTECVLFEGRWGVAVSCDWRTGRDEPATPDTVASEDPAGAEAGT